MSRKEWFIINPLLKRQQQIIDFGNSTEFKELDAYYSRPSIFSALGVSRHENTHSNFLAWLLKPSPEKNDHGLGDMPLRKLLETLALICSSLKHAAGKMPPELISAIISGGYLLSDIDVRREYHLDGAGRLDIYIAGVIAFDDTACPLTIAIENKVSSTENDSQTRRYQDALERAVSSPGILLSVFLTPLNKCDYEGLDAPKCEAKEFIQLNYQYLADYVIEPCRDQTPVESIKQYLDEYLFALALPEIRQDKGDVIMAISKEERDLLSRFWDKHKDLLIATLLATADSDALEGDERSIVQKASRALKSVAQRDLTRYTWTFLGEKNQNLSKRQLVQEVIAFYAHAKPDLTAAELCDKFPGAVATLEVAKTKSAACYNLGADQLIKCSNGLIAAYNQWHRNNIKAFIANAEKLGYKITSTE